MHFRIMALTRMESLKADMDPNYAPEEHEVEVFKAKSIREANSVLSKGRKSGRLHMSARVELICSQCRRPCEIDGCPNCGTDSP
jgi:rubrerythrin